MKFLLCLLFLLISLSDGNGKIIELNDDNWEQVLVGEWMIEFYAPWCPACQSLQAAWTEFSNWSDDLHLSGIAGIDVTKSPGLSGRFLVTGLPSIFHAKDGVFRLYRGSRDKESFVSFIEEEDWKNLESISSWKDPRSFQMTIVSYFFKISMILRQTHVMITDVYGYPYWVSYIVFSIATMILGALLGLILVCVIDFVCPPNRNQSLASNLSVETESEDHEDIGDDKVEEESFVRKRKAKKAE